MSQVHKSIIAQPIPLREETRFAAATAIVAGISAAVVAGVFIISSMTSAPAAIRTPGVTNLDKVVDGWMPAVAAAQAARLTRLQDGYLPGLLAARHAGDAVDGYLPGLLAGRSSGDAVDGYLPGLLAGRSSGDAIDGWEAGILP